MSPLLDLVKDEIASVTADGAYHGAPTYQAVAARAGNIGRLLAKGQYALNNNFESGGTNACLVLSKI